MKELTIEQKAKAYDEALKRARKLKEDPQGVFYEYSPKERETICEYIFPELRESENEKIRNGIIKYLSYIKDRDGSYMPNNIPFDDMIAWLERQGEQKPAWSEEDDIMIEETLYFLREYQQSNRCKDENGMQNSVSCEKWLKSLKERIGG